MIPTILLIQYGLRANSRPLKVRCDLCRAFRDELLDLGFCYECWETMTPARLTALFEYVVAERPSPIEEWRQGVRRELAAQGRCDWLAGWVVSKVRKLAAWWKAWMP